MHDGVFVRSIYFQDPDGILLEFACWTRPFDAYRRPSRPTPAPSTPPAAPAEPAPVFDAASERPTVRPAVPRLRQVPPRGRRTDRHSHVRLALRGPRPRHGSGDLRRHARQLVDRRRPRPGHPRARGPGVRPLPIAHRILPRCCESSRSRGSVSRRGASSSFPSTANPSGRSGCARTDRAVPGWAVPSPSTTQSAPSSPTPTASRLTTDACPMAVRRPSRPSRRRADSGAHLHHDALPEPRGDVRALRTEFDDRDEPVVEVPGPVGATAMHPGTGPVTAHRGRSTRPTRRQGTPGSEHRGVVERVLLLRLRDPTDQAALGGWLRLGLYPNRQVAWWTAWIVRPGALASSPWLPLTPVPPGELLVSLHVAPGGHPDRDRPGPTARGVPPSRRGTAGPASSSRPTRGPL